MFTFSSHSAAYASLLSAPLSFSRLSANKLFLIVYEQIENNTAQFAVVNVCSSFNLHSTNKCAVLPNQLPEESHDRQCRLCSKKTFENNRVLWGVPLI